MNNFTGLFNSNEKISRYLNQSSPELLTNNAFEYSADGKISELDSHTILFFGNAYNFEQTYNIQKNILRNYLDNGIESFKSLDGEFTFFIQNKNETLIHRDRHGAGPQVYYNEAVFSSFLKNFLNLKNFVSEPNKEALFTFLSIGYIPSPMCSLKGVSKIPAGHVLTVRNGEQKLETLYTWEDFKNSCANPRNISAEEATAEYEHLHKKSILDRVKGKKTVGLLLSGGYDSGGNIAGLREVFTGEALSYSIGFKDNPWSELPLAKILSDRFGTTHFEYEINGTEIKELPDIIDYLGDPFQEGGLMLNYAAMKLIGENKPEVILGGDGNDQHFGTAGKELAMNWTFRKKGYSVAQKIYAGLGWMGIFNNDNIFFRTQFYNEKILNIQKSDNFGFKTHELKKLILSKKTYWPHQYLNNVPTNFIGFDEFYFVHNYFGDIKQVINEVILFKASKMASLFENNISFPYMNTEIYNFLKTMPRNYKCKGTVDDLAKGKGDTKFLHKNYLKPKLPKEITDRKKQGGFAPLPIFFNDNIQRKKLQDFILNSNATNRLFSEKYLIKFFKNYDSNVKSGGYWFWYKQVKAFQFFNLLVVCVWWEIFINKKSKGEIRNLIN